MGGRGPSVDACAREIYAEWAACQHFELYDEVPGVLRQLASAGIRLGLISNSHRCLASFQSHFELRGLIAATVSSSEHGLMKPHPSIFAAALQLVNVPAADAVMVGDSVRQDVDGALRAGMRAVLLHRSPGPHPRAARVRRVRSAGDPLADGAAVAGDRVGLCGFSSVPPTSLGPWFLSWPSFLCCQCPAAVVEQRPWTMDGQGRKDQGQRTKDQGPMNTHHPGGHAMLRPPSRCRWMWKTVCPASRLVLKTVRNPPAEIPRALAMSGAHAARSRRGADRPRR